jgi:hypothetical protein
LPWAMATSSDLSCGPGATQPLGPPHPLVPPSPAGPHTDRPRDSDPFPPSTEHDQQSHRAGRTPHDRQSHPPVLRRPRTSRGCFLARVSKHCGAGRPGREHPELRCRPELRAPRHPAGHAGPALRRVGAPVTIPARSARPPRIGSPPRPRPRRGDPAEPRPVHPPTLTWVIGQNKDRKLPDLRKPGRSRKIFGNSG